MKSGSTNRIVIIGIGNEMRGDDRIGMEIVKRLERKIKNRNIFFIKTSYIENEIKRIARLKPKKIIIIDAAEIGKKPGEFSILSKNELSSLVISTHSIPLPVILEYLDSFINAKIIILGIQVKCTELGKKMSNEVRKSIRRICEFIERRII